jgi:2-polyprenyl-3-methyl-5-hydroxy-6-metoxy-1,4-benzoquinol methylase
MLTEIFSSNLLMLVAIGFLYFILKQIQKRNIRLFKSHADPYLPVPPTDPADITGWDLYWIENMRQGFGPALFDMFTDDRDLIRVMNAEGMMTILCAGCGISQEPRALAEAGFKVTALDFSARAIEVSKEIEFTAEDFERFCDPDMRRPGGHINYFVGNILDADIFMGPFDVIIERCTAQLYFNKNIDTILDVLASHLHQNGIFLSQCHDACWKPPAEPRHFTKQWFQKNGWKLWNGIPLQKPAGRVAWLCTSTG